MESKARFLGLPLIHVAVGRMENGVYRRGVARGWIAIGDVALGVIAIGGVGIGLVTLGGFGLGLLALGGASVGAVAVGGATVGLFAFGGLAVGYESLGGLAVAWHAAAGGLAIAREYASGGSAYARHANDAAAQAFFMSDAPLKAGAAFLRNSRWLLLFAFLPAAIVLFRGFASSNEDRRPTHP